MSVPNNQSKLTNFKIDSDDLSPKINNVITNFGNNVAAIEDCRSNQLSQTGMYLPGIFK